MKKLDIDPLFLIFSVLIIFILSIYTLNNKKEQKLDSFRSYIENKSTIIKYNDLKKSWATKSVQISKVNNIIKTMNIKNANIIQTNNKIEVNIKSNINNIHRFTNKLLNEKINIKRLKITKDSIYFQVGLI